MRIKALLSAFALAASAIAQQDTLPFRPGSGQGGGRGDGSGGGRRWQQAEPVVPSAQPNPAPAQKGRSAWRPSKRVRFDGLWTSEWHGDADLAPAELKELSIAMKSRYRSASNRSERLAAARALVDSAMAFGKAGELYAWADTLLLLADADTALLVKAHAAKGEALLRDGRVGRAFDDLRNALQLNDERRDPGTAAWLHARIGDGLMRMGGSTGAAQRYQEVLRIAGSAQVDDRMKHHAHAALAFIAYDAERWEDAAAHHEQALRLSRAIGDPKREAASLRGLAMVAVSRGERAQAAAYFTAAQELLKSYPELARELLDLRLSFGETLLAEGREIEARQELRAAIRMADSLDDGAASARARLFLAAALGADHRAALRLLDEADALARTAGLGILRKEVALDRSERFAALGRHAEAHAQAVEALRLTDSLNLAYWSEGQRRQRQRSEVGLKDRDIADLEQQKSEQLARAREQQERIAEQRRAIIAALAIGLVVLVLAIVAFRAYRAQRRTARALELAHAETLRQKQRAEESERTKDRFLANVSHEIRTPLNAIMGFTDILLQEHRDARTRGFLEAVQGAGENLLVVINDLLDLGRIEAGRLTLVKEAFDLHAAVHRTAQLLQHRAAERGNALVVHIDAAVPQWVEGDSARLAQILLNLAGNALKFTEEGEVRIEVARETDAVRFSVIDDGIGIPPEKLSSIFDRFTQVDVTDQRRHGGAGLGLAIVKELVALHGGRIHAESEPGKGSVFTVRLPYAETTAPMVAHADDAAAPSSQALRDRIVLVAEDNELNAIVTTETMKRYYPYAHVEVVGDGRAAVDRLKQDDGSIALVLMDVQMPVLDGLAATRELRALQGPIGSVPIIALTASVLPADLSRCIEAGMDACVSKPFRAPELVQAIARLTGDAGIQPDNGADAPDPYAELFHELMPERLQRLRDALAADDREAAHRLVHILRPQLVHRDAARFAQPCDALLGASAAHGEWRQGVSELINLLELELA